MNSLVNLAKQAVENYIKDNIVIIPPVDLPNEFLTRKAGTFVTIEKCASSAHPPTRRELRGCIGTYLPTRENIAEEIIYNAIAAATEDYRFGPIQGEELPHLSYTVYILSEPELVNPHTTTRIISALRQERQSSFGVGVKDISELNPKKFGIIVKSKTKCGLLLPDLEGVDTIEKQISICCQKGGIDPLKEKIFIYRFTVEKYGQ